MCVSVVLLPCCVCFSACPLVEAGAAGDEGQPVCVCACTRACVRACVHVQPCCTPQQSGVKETAHRAFRWPCWRTIPRALGCRARITVCAATTLLVQMRHANQQLHEVAETTGRLATSLMALLQQPQHLGAAAAPPPSVSVALLGAAVVACGLGVAGGILAARWAQQRT
jgi:hypothetical protein